jgi:phage shock protein PspC (stress-responsive transcriptional regulator)
MIAILCVLYGVIAICVMGFAAGIFVADIMSIGQRFDIWTIIRIVSLASAIGIFWLLFGPTLYIIKLFMLDESKRKVHY